MTDRTRLAVLGSPIHHSKSPAIQAAAYAVLGLPWQYGSADVTGDALPAYLDGLDDTWRGLSLTMPLKRDVLPLLDVRHTLVEAVGAANTVLLTDAGRLGFNTDVPGVVAALREGGADGPGVEGKSGDAPAVEGKSGDAPEAERKSGDRPGAQSNAGDGPSAGDGLILRDVLILGGGATAASTLVGVAELGAERATVLVRTPERAAPLRDLGARVGVAVEIVELPKTQEFLGDTPDAVISTLPGGSDLLRFRPEVRAAALLFDVAYDPWPSPLARAWDAVGGRVVHGHDLLVHQALVQVRIFVHGDPESPLPDEPAVLAAMRAAL